MLHSVVKHSPNRTLRVLVGSAIGLLIGGLGASCATSQAQTVAADAVIVRIDGVEIRESDVAAAQNDIGATLPDSEPEKKREFLVSYLIDSVLLAREAEHRKIVGDAEIRKLTDLARKNELMERILSRQGQAAITDSALREAFKQTQRPEADFDKLRNELAATLYRKAQTDFIAKMRAEAKIERFDEAPAGEGSK